MDDLLFRATITVEVLAPNRREAERLLLQAAQAVDDTDSPVRTAWPLPEPRVVMHH